MGIEALLLGPSGSMPNHPSLPVLFYKAVQEVHDSSFFEQTFAANGWRGIWVNGVFDYHHYHTTAHEVLGVSRGEATLQIGGPDGPVIDVTQGDCLLLPAGTGHKRLDSARGFQVVGAYPTNGGVDIQTGAASEAMLERIKTVAIPKRDPLFGQDGGLVDLWRER